MTPPKYVGVILAHTNANFRLFLNGVLDYVNRNGGWSLDLRTGRRNERPASAAELVRCNGVIANELAASTIRRLRGNGVPVILISTGKRASRDVPVVHSDNPAIARAAAEYLLGKRCASYAYVPEYGARWSAERGRAFAAELAKAGQRLNVLEDGDAASLGARLAALPRPVAVFAACDMKSRDVLDACRSADLRIPDDVSILGVDDDELLCRMSSPALSSIPLDFRSAGFRAAEILERMMSGELNGQDAPDILYDRGEVVERLSTQRSISTDMIAARCLDYLQRNFSRPLRVGEIAAELHVGRRTLEKKFREATGKTINAELIRLRIEKATQLLRLPQNSHESIAAACGFYDATHLRVTLRRHGSR